MPLDGDSSDLDAYADWANNASPEDLIGELLELRRFQRTEAELVGLQRWRAGAFDAMDSFARTMLSVAGVVFGLTVGFVSPNVHHLSGYPTALLMTALGSLSGSLAFGLVGVLAASLASLWAKDDEVTSNRDGPHRYMWTIGASALLFLIGIASLTTFTVYQLRH